VDWAPKKWPCRAVWSEPSSVWGRAFLATLATWRESFLQSIDDAGDTVFDQGDVEVDQQSQSLVGQLQISEELLLCTGAMVSTALISTITWSSTNRSA